MTRPPAGPPAGPPAARRPPLIRATYAIHLGTTALALLRPELAPWLGAVLLGNHLVLLNASLWPRGQLLGPNLVRLPAAGDSAPRTVALTFDDGPDPEVTPRVLDLLAAADARATFFLIGERARRHPELVRRIADEGHGIGNHTESHLSWFCTLPSPWMRREIERAQEAIAAVTGEVPTLFRPPAGHRSPWLHSLLRRRRLALVSWTHRAFDTREREPDAIHARLCRFLQPRDILLLHDGNCARDSQGRPVVLSVLPRLLQTLRDRKLEPISLPHGTRRFDRRADPL